MNFLEKKIFPTTHNAHNAAKHRTEFFNQNSLSFLEDCQEDCKKWFEDDYENLSSKAGKQDIHYIEQFGLEKSGKKFTLLPELKSAIAGYFNRCQIKCNLHNIIVRAGIFEILQDLYRAVDFQDNEKILFTLPVSGYFVQQCHNNGILTEFLNTDSKNSWKIDFVELEAILNKHQIKILFLNYPNNISGTILNKNDALVLATVLRKHKNLLVVIDESLLEIAANQNCESLSLASIDDISSQIITISNLKCYGSGTLDIAFACLRNKAMIDEMFSDEVNISQVNQHIAIATLRNNEDSQKHLAEIIEQCHQNYSLVVNELKIINENLGQKFNKKEELIQTIENKNQISTSILLQFSGLKGSQSIADNKTITTDLAIAEFLKNEAGIAMMTGQSCLLPEEEMILRLYLLKSKQELKAGFQRINQALMQLKMLSKNLSGATSSKLATKETDKSR